MAQSSRKPRSTNEEKFTSLEEAWEPEMEMAQEEDAPQEEGAEDA